MKSQRRMTERNGSKTEEETEKYDYPEEK